MDCNGCANLSRQRLLAGSSASIPKLHRTLRINMKTQVLSCCADTQHNYDGELLLRQLPANDYLALLRLAPRIVYLYREGRFELAGESRGG